MMPFISEGLHSRLGNVELSWNSEGPENVKECRQKLGIFILMLIFCFQFDIFPSQGHEDSEYFDLYFFPKWLYKNLEWSKKFCLKK